MRGSCRARDCLGARISCAKSDLLRIAEQLVEPLALDHAFDHNQMALTVHLLLGHNKRGNVASHVPRTIYYRLAASGHEEQWESTFLDPWTEYAPVRQALAQSAGS